MIFTLKTGRKIEKPAQFCVATKARGRWNHQFYKNWQRARNEFKSVQSHLKNPDMVAYYGLEDVSFLKGE